MAPVILLLAAWAAAAGPATFTAVGDIRLDGPISGVEAPMADIQELLTGDVIFGNLECPVSTKGEKTPKTFNFRADPKSLKKLKGFHVLNLANNHTFDYGIDALLDTLKHVEKDGFTIVGAGYNRGEAEGVKVFERSGLKIGVMGFTSTHPEAAWAKATRPGVAYSDFARLPSVIAAAKKKADVLVVSLHGGTELAEHPNEIQKAFGRMVIDAGADAVVGHHPHVLQAVELYKGKPILHSVGNFLFVSPSTGTNLSVIAKLSLDGTGVKEIVFEPIDINGGKLKRAAPADAQRIFQILDRQGALSQHPHQYRVSGITVMDATPPDPPEPPLKR